MKFPWTDLPQTKVNESELNGAKKAQKFKTLNKYPIYFIIQYQYRFEFYAMAQGSVKGNILNQSYMVTRQTSCSARGFGTQVFHFYKFNFFPNG